MAIIPAMNLRVPELRVGIRRLNPRTGQRSIAFGSVLVEKVGLDSYGWVVIDFEPELHRISFVPSTFGRPDGIPAHKLVKDGGTARRALAVMFPQESPLAALPVGTFVATLDEALIRITVDYGGGPAMSPP